jgi:hypothetical protein
MSNRRVAPSNRWPVNQAALRWLQAAKEPADEDISYLVQLAWWGLENWIRVPPPRSPSQPTHEDLELALGQRLARGPRAAKDATRWLLANPNLAPGEEEENLLLWLESATSPMEAARLVIETVYDRMTA